MDIYNSSSLTFEMPYDAKRLLDDSVTRTLRGYSSICAGEVLTGCGNILLARIESAAAWAFVALSSAVLMLGSTLMTPCFLIPATVLNLASRIPGVSSFESVQNFTRDSSNAIYRTLKVHFIAIPVIFLFLSASSINTFIPGILKPQNVFFSSVHRMVEPLGPLQTIRATVSGVTSIVGTETELSALDAAEEYLRALSCQNYLREETVSRVTHHYSYQR